MSKEKVKTSNRRVTKWLLWSLALVAVAIGLYLSLFFFPYPLFRHHVDFDGFDVYSDREITPDFEFIVEDARARIERMGVDPRNPGLRIFVCNSQRLFVLINRLAGKRHFGQALVISAAGNAFFSVEGIAAIGKRNGGRPVHSRLEGSWSAAIAHELAHIVIGADPGSPKQRDIPPWKSEGSADYLANLAAAESDPDYDFVARISMLLDDSLWRPPITTFDRRHFRWHVLVEYLCAVQGLSFEELIDPTVEEDGAWSELKTWYSTRLQAEGID